MNWEAIGAVGEVAGAIAVTVTLIVLILQLRRNTEEMRAATIQSLFDTSTSLFSETIASPIPEIIAKFEAEEALCAADERRLQLFYRRNFQLFEQVHFHHMAGRVSDEVMQAYEARIIGQLGNRGWDDVWSTMKPSVTKNFAAYVERLRNEA